MDLPPDGVGEPFGLASSVAGQLTTTRTSPGSTQKEGLHLDSGDRRKHGLGVCAAGVRQFLTVTHSAELLLGDSTHTTGSLRRYLAKDEGRLSEVAILHIPLNTFYVYDAWTGTLGHDGSTLRTPKASNNNQVFFVEL